MRKSIDEKLDLTTLKDEFIKLNSKSIGSLQY